MRITKSETESETHSETLSDVTIDDSDDQPLPSKKLKMALLKAAVVEILKKRPFSIPIMESIIKTWNTGLSADEIGTK